MKRIETEDQLLMMALGVSLRQAMGAAGMSAVDLAVETDYAPAKIEEIADGEGDPLMGIEVIVILSIALRCEVGFLIEGVRWIPGQSPQDIGRYALADPANFPREVDQQAVDASVRSPMSMEFEIATMIRLAGALKTTPSDLMEGVDKRLRKGLKRRRRRIRS